MADDTADTIEPGADETAALMGGASSVREGVADVLEASPSDGKLSLVFSKHYIMDVGLLQFMRLCRFFMLFVRPFKIKPWYKD